MPRLRRAVEALARRDDRRRPRRCRRPTSATTPTSCCGSRRSRASRHGRRRRASRRGAVRAGTSNARRWPGSISAKSSTSMAAASTWCFRIMRTRLAQTCCAFHTDRMANVWMHNGFLQVEGEKMSKSLGNFFTIREHAGRLAGRGAAPQHAEDALSLAARLDHEGRWRKARRRSTTGIADRGRRRGRASRRRRWVDALLDDLNTAQAMAVLHGLRNAAATGGERERGEFAASLRLLGFLSAERCCMEGTQAAGERRRSEAGRST